MTKRISLVEQKNTISPPDLLGLQLESFKKLFQVDSRTLHKKKAELYKIFQENFPISDAKENFTIEFVDYIIEDPVYTPDECLQKKLTYSVALKIKLRLVSKEEEKTKNTTQTIFLGHIPYMTPQGTFIVNGKERIVVSQIHRSYGVFFSENTHISGTKIYFAKIIPLKGAWIEFVTDNHKCMYAYIDRRKKLPITLVLRALGYGTDKDIFNLLGLGKEIEVTPANLKENKGAKIAGRLVKDYLEEFVDPETGEVISMTRSEVLLERNTILDDISIQTILESGEETIVLHQEEKSTKATLIYNTLKKDETSSEKEAIEELYRKLRNTEPPDEESARIFVEQLFFSPQRTYLGKVGRYSINKKLSLNISQDIHTLTKEDLIKTIEYLFRFIKEKMTSTDIDHLANRRIRDVGEQLYDVFNVAIPRLARIIRERMSVRVSEEFRLIDLVSTKILSSAVTSFFGTDPLSQLADQTNLLSELSQKRRFSAMGKGGLSKNRPGIEARDLHYSQNGRVCPVTTPDGANVGLIGAKALYAKIDEMGFVQTPYKKIIGGKLDSSDKIHYFTADQDESQFIIQFTTDVDEEGNVLTKKVKARKKGGIFSINVKEKDVVLMYIDKDQVLSVDASNIPFLKHNDNTRTLLGANMIRQAIPLVQPQVPIVGTGIERRVVKDCRILPQAQEEGVVTYVDANKIIVTSPSPEGIDLSFNKRTYPIKRLTSTNQNTSINLKPIVAKGQKVKKGDILCEGYGTRNGELALGRNLNVAYMSYKGYNYEDAIVISEEVAEKYTSLHIYEHIIEARDTKLGPEKFTSDIPNMREEQLQNLDQNGIIAVGTRVKPGDLLVGKVTPKAQKDLMPENALLQAIFGEKACNVKDTSLRAGPSVEGTVIGTKLFKRHARNKQTREEITRKLALLKKLTNKKLLDLKKKNIELLSHFLADKKTTGVYDKEKQILIAQGQYITKELLEEKIFSTKEEKINLETSSIKHINLTNWVVESNTAKTVEALLKNHLSTHIEIISNYKKEKFAIEVGDDLPPDVLQRVKILIAKKRKLQVGDKMATRYGNKGIVAKIEANEDMPYKKDGQHMDIILSPLAFSARMIVGNVIESTLGLAGQKLQKNYACKPFDKIHISKIEEELTKADIPGFGTTTLYDGVTGEPFQEKVTCGVTYMLKLNHLVDEKIHARSVGAYTLVTRQPLGGRAHFGGQKIGEMETSALEAHGAAHTVREISIKSDDREGGKRAIEAMVKGKNLPVPGIPEGFNVLKSELAGLCLELTLRQKNDPRLKI